MTDDHAHQVLMSNADAIKRGALSFKRGALSIWTIYDRPRDHPDGFIARRFEVVEGVTAATRDTVTGKLEDIRLAFWKAGLLKLTRQHEDEPQVVESWV